MSDPNLSSFIWSVADLLRGDYKQSEYGRVSNREPAHRKGKLQLIDASSFWQKMRKSLGSNRKELSPEHIEEITRLFGECREAYLDESSGEIGSRHIPCAVSPNSASGGFGVLGNGHY